MSKTQYTSAGYDTTSRRSTAAIARTGQHSMLKRAFEARISNQEVNVQRNTMNRHPRNRLHHYIFN